MNEAHRIDEHHHRSVQVVIVAQLDVLVGERRLEEKTHLLHRRVERHGQTLHIGLALLHRVHATHVLGDVDHVTHGLRGNLQVADALGLLICFLHLIERHLQERERIAEVVAEDAEQIIEAVFLLALRASLLRLLVEVEKAQDGSEEYEARDD